MEQFLELAQYGFMETGLGWAIAGAMLALALGSFGSCCGMATAGPQAIGVMTEKPDMFSKVFILTLLPSSQGLYGLVFAVLIALFIGLPGENGIEAAHTLTPVTGIAIMITGLLVGVVLLASAVYQAKVVASSIQMVARREDQFGRSIMFPALIETFAVFALLMGIIVLSWLVIDESTVLLS